MNYSQNRKGAEMHYVRNLKTVLLRHRQLGPYGLHRYGGFFQGASE